MIELMRPFQGLYRQLRVKIRIISTTMRHKTTNWSHSFACGEVLVCVQALGLPVYWKSLLYNFAGGDRTGHVTQQAVLDAYKRYSVIHIV